jgi:hypothetical protein
VLCRTYTPRKFADTESSISKLSLSLYGASSTAPFFYFDQSDLACACAKANLRLKQAGPNEITREKHQSTLMRLLGKIS